MGVATVVLPLLLDGSITTVVLPLSSSTQPHAPEPTYIARVETMARIAQAGETGIRWCELQRAGTYIKPTY